MGIQYSFTPPHYTVKIIGSGRLFVIMALFMKYKAVEIHLLVNGLLAKRILLSVVKPCGWLFVDKERLGDQKLC